MGSLATAASLVLYTGKADTTVIAAATAAVPASDTAARVTVAAASPVQTSLAVYTGQHATSPHTPTELLYELTIPHGGWGEGEVANQSGSRSDSSNSAWTGNGAWLDLSSIKVAPGTICCGPLV